MTYFPRYSRRRRQTMIGSSSSHDSLQQAILLTLNNPNECPNTWAFPMETKGKEVRDQYGGIKFIPNPFLNGVGKPDIGGVKGSKAFFIEVKFGKDQLRKNQSDWLIDCVEIGKAKAGVARSVDDAVEFWGTV